MTGPQRLTLFLAAALATVSGLAYWWCLHIIESDDPFSAYNHPLQPWALDAHLLVGPALVFVIGWIFQSHVLDKLAGGEPWRRSGIALLVLSGLVLVTGALLAVVSDPGPREALGWGHFVVCVSWAVVLVVHAIRGRRLARERAAAVQALLDGLETSPADGDPAPAGKSVP